MLKEIIIKNFTSFKEETLFSMEADYGRVSEHEDHIVSINNNKLLKVASFYGPNGGGKTNFLYSLLLLKLVQEYGELINVNVDLSCIFCKSNKIEETVFFVDEMFEIGYRIEVSSLFEDIDKIESAISETTNSKKTKFFIEKEELVYRAKGTSEYIDLLTRDQDGTLKIANEKIFLSNDFKLAKTKSAVKYIYDTFANNDKNDNILFDVIKHLSEQVKSINVLDLYLYSTENFDSIIKYHDELVELLNSVDIKIDSIIVDKKARQISFVRNIIIDGVIEKKIFPLNVESTGTHKIFKLFVTILKNIEKGNIFYCDDMNAYLHPKLYRKIIEIFQSNKNHSQLIFNSHDIINMDNELFRRDEIWFAYRDENYISRLIPLSNIVNYKGKQVRKDANYYKQYLEGKYGADPFVKRGLDWHE